MEDNRDKVMSTEVQQKERLLQVTFEDKTEALYSFAWLRDNAPEPSTMEIKETVQNRKFLLADLDVNIIPLKTSIDDNGDLIIQWPDLNYPVKYTPIWLRQRNFNDRKLHEERERYHLSSIERFGSKDIEKEFESPADWNRLLDPNQEEYLLKHLERFLKYGILRIVNVPQEEREAHKFVNMMGYFQYTPYGDSFHIHSKPRATISSVGYTNQPLGLHTDQPAMVNSPEVIVFHVIQQAAQGGDSYLCDALRVADQLEEEQPKAYQMLCTVSVEHVDRGKDWLPFNFVNCRPIFRLGRSGKADAVFYSNHVRSWFMDLPSEKVPEMYDAIKIFHNYSMKEENLIKYKINSGEIIVFSNTRFMHGRAGFTISDEVSFERHIEGTYLMLDCFTSKVRVLKSKLCK